ncbi:hypothetical protein [Propionivibrio sp.]|uniref:hypothetical protein n=1 Tax=Propionivibrio sp. TaxID=2212460 RepID=UPI003BF2D787
MASLLKLDSPSFQTLQEKISPCPAKPGRVRKFFSLRTRNPTVCIDVLDPPEGAQQKTDSSRKKSRHHPQRGYNLRLKRFGIPNLAEDIPSTMIVKEKQFSTSSDSRIRAGEEAVQSWPPEYLQNWTTE